MNIVLYFQLALCDFLMAIGPMVVLFAMVTGRIDINSSGGCAVFIYLFCLTGSSYIS